MNDDSPGSAHWNAEADRIDREADIQMEALDPESKAKLVARLMKDQALNGDAMKWNENH